VFPDHKTEEAIEIGKGTLHLVAFPTELSENDRATSSLYASAIAAVGAQSYLRGRPLPPNGVLVYSLDLETAVLYIFESELANDTTLHFKDPSTNAEINVSLRSQHAALALIDKKTKQIVAKYGLP